MASKDTSVSVHTSANGPCDHTTSNEDTRLVPQWLQRLSGQRRDSIGFSDSQLGGATPPSFYQEDSDSLPHSGFAISKLALGFGNVEAGSYQIGGSITEDTFLSVCRNKSGSDLANSVNDKPEQTLAGFLSEAKEAKKLEDYGQEGFRIEEAQPKITQVMSQAIPLTDFPVATEESLSTIQEIAEKNQELNEAAEDMFAFDTEDVKPKVEEETRLSSILRKTGLGQTWLFKGNDEADDEDIEDEERHRRRRQARQGQEKGIAQLYNEHQAERKKNAARELNIMAPQAM